MKTEFDPYRKWLGIPPSEQPPNHYRLLGIGLYETDKDVISNAADRQMAHIRTFQTGKYSELSQQILNELSAARVTLLDAKQRAAYDEKLREEESAKKPEEATVAAVKVVPVPVGGVAPPQPSAAPPAAPPAVPPAAPTQVIASVPPPIPGGAAARAGARKKKKDPTVMIAVLGTVVIFLVLLLVFAMQGGSENAQKTPSENDKNTSGSATSRPKPSPAPVKPAGNNGNPSTSASRTKPDNSAEAARKAAEMERIMNTSPDEVVEEIIDMPGENDPKVPAEEVTPEMLLYATGGLFDTETVPGREHTPLLSMEELDALAAAEASGGSNAIIGAASPERIITKAPAGPRNGISPAKLTADVKGLDYRKTSTKENGIREQYLKYYGGTEESEKAVGLGLVWLDKNRGGVGGKYWDYNHAKLPNGKNKNTSKDPGTLKAPISATALSMVALLGAGNSPKTGKQRQAAAEGMKSLATAAQPVSGTDYLPPQQLHALKANKMQATELSLAEKSNPYLHAHAWSTLAFCEAYWFMQDSKPSDAKVYGEIALRLVAHVFSQQNPAGGWPRKEAVLDNSLYPIRYTDTDSVEATVWNLMALKSAKDAQLLTKEQERKLLLSQEKAAKFLRGQMQLYISNLKNNTTAGNEPAWSARQLSSATLETVRGCLLGLRLADAKLSDKEETVLLSVAATLMEKEPRMENGLSNFQTALLVRDIDPEGWQAWNEKLRETYIAAQENDRAEQGSWFYALPDHVEMEVGRLYCTALALLYLESYYRCPPLAGAE